MLSRERFVLVLLIASLAGVGAASFLELSYAAIVISAIGAVLLLVVGNMNGARSAFVVGVVMLGLALGAARFMLWKNAPTDGVLEHEVGSSITLHGIVSDEPDVREGKTHLTITVSMTGTDTPLAIEEGVLVIVPRYPAFAYGDALRLEGKLVRPATITEDDGSVFDYPSYLASKGIRHEMIFPKIEKEGKEKGNTLVASLFKIKAYFEGAIARAVPEPEGALLSGLLLGGKTSLGAEWLDRFRRAGIVHIVVLSGYNMTIVSEWLVVLFRFLGFFGSLAAGGAGILLFAVLVGGGATVWRAAIMALLVLIAKATGRTYDITRALLVAASVMVALNPSILVYDPSFELSFLASFGLIALSPRIDWKLRSLRRTPMLREVLVSTLATQIFVLPLLLRETGLLSLVSLPANLLVLPLIPPTMFFGFVAGVAALISPFLGIIVGFPAFILLRWILLVASFASGLPFGAVDIGHISIFTVLILYGVIAYVLFRTRSPSSASPEKLASHR